MDDSVALRKILGRAIRQTALPIREIHEACDGVEAAEKLETLKVGLVVTDMNMPRMTGLQLLALIRASPKLRPIPVVILATEGGEDFVSQAVQLGAAGYIKKPFTASLIRETLARVLSRAA